MIEFDASGLDSASLRSAGKELLSLALIDARNHTLRWASALEGAADGRALVLPGDLAAGLAAELDPALWTLGHIGWFQEYWIARNVQRARGERADPTHPRLASILPEADAWYDVATVDRPRRRALVAGDLPDLQSTRAYLVETLETTLELLAGIAAENDASLYFHRLALFHEEMHAEAFSVLAQTLGIDTGLVARITTRPARAPLLFPATRWLLGTSGAGFRFDNEAEPHPVDVPEFEIDAQAVTWAQYGEFVEDGGYDERALWSEAGWEWLQKEGRRTPRHVDQMRHGVLQRRFGVLARVAASHPAVHVSWHEADAWCRWAGRRLPAEVEWEAAAHQGATRGFRWGEVHEWTASTFRPYPGFVAGPWRDYSLPAFGTHKVLRGASFATRAGLHSARLRAFERPERDAGFFGFRSCAA
ncbi:MAG: SUMF1/EgtB/PvdO family nonheme iron enzyme [Pseudomonadota bacterium]|nr:SUMF1/EgtB/PvdO family nonheme iron enzyme [Pseudomonadota bacterium]